MFRPMPRNHRRAGRGFVLAAVLVLAVVLAGCSGGRASESASADSDRAATESETDEARAFFEGKTITLVVDRAPGGGYDQYARMVAPYLAEQLDAEVVVENQPGAGGLLAMNNLVTEKPDGLTIAIFNAPGMLPAVIGGAEGANFSPTDLTWIGRVGGEEDVIVVPTDSPLKTFDDLLAASDLTFGSSGPGAADYVNPAILIDVLGLDGEIVTGFDGSAEIELGLLRGDVDVMTGTLDSRLPSIESGETRALAVLSAEPAEQLPDVPPILDFDLSDEQRQILETHFSVGQIGRPIVGPPGMDPGTTEVLREALRVALEQPGIISDSEELGRPISYLSGAEQAELAQTLVDAPERYRQVLSEAYGGAVG